jgi:hypothetical protein
VVCTPLAKTRVHYVILTSRPPEDSTVVMRKNWIFPFSQMIS